MSTSASLECDVVAVGAHPDDIEITCGGTLARLAELGYRVGIIDLTNGEPTPRCPDPAVRLEEARRAAEVLGVHERIILDLPNRQLFDSVEARLLLAKQLRRLRPRVVIGFGGKTPLASPDHWQAMQITDAAVFYARLSKWSERFDGLPEHLVHTQLYFSGFHPDFAPTVTSQFVMDISATLEKKMESLRAYQTQFPPEKQHVFFRVESTARWVGSLAGCEAGEMFGSARPLGTRDLMKLLYS